MKTLCTAMLLLLAAAAHAQSDGPIKSNFGHYFAAQAWDSAADATSLCEHAGVKGVIIRRAWAEVEPSAGVYDFSAFDEVLDAISRSKNPACQIWMFVEFKSFQKNPVRNPCPAYLRQAHSALTIPASEGSYACFMWDAVTSNAFVALMHAAAARYDQNPRFEGFVVQESALGFNGTQSQDVPTGTYTAAAWRDTLIRYVQECTSAFAHSRCMFFLNFIRGGQDYLHTVSAAISEIPDNRGCFSGPDLLPNDEALFRDSSSVYQVLIRHAGCRANSAQNNSFQVPGCALDCIFRFAVSGTFGTFNSDSPLTSGVCVNSYIFWNHLTRKGQTGLDWTNALPVIAANPYGPLWYSRCIGGEGTL